MCDKNVSIFNGPGLGVNAGRGNRAAKAPSLCDACDGCDGLRGLLAYRFRGARMAEKNSPRSGPVSLSEALERLLPHCDNNPHKVASRLDAQHRDGDLPLLGGKAVIDPITNPSMLGMKARILSTGKAVLYVQVREGLDGKYPIWDGKDLESLRKHHAFWTFDRALFETHFPVSVDRGGRPPKYNRADILIE